jgi:hypothetical protein
MKSTKLIISNEKTTVSLPTVDDLKNSNTGSIGTGQALIYFPDINKLGTGEAGSNNQLAPGTSAQHIFYVQDYGQTVAGLPGNPMRPYRSIQAAVDAAAAGDTIIILPGGDAVDYLGRRAYSEAVQITQSLNIVFEGGVASGYWVFGTYPGATYNIRATVKNGIWTNGLAVISSNGQQCRHFFDNCSFEDKTTVFQLVPSGFEQANATPGLDKQYFTNCRFNNTNSTGGDGVFKFQGRDDATPTQHLNIYLQDCQLESLNTPIATGYASVYHLVYLRGSTDFILDSKQIKQTVVRVNSGTITNTYSSVIDDNELFIDERFISSGNNSVLIINELAEYVAAADGVQNITLPENTKGVLDVNIEESTGVCRPVYQKNYSIGNNILTIAAKVGIKAGNRICGSYYTDVTANPLVESVNILDVQGDDAITIINISSN